MEKQTKDISTPFTTPIYSEDPLYKELELLEHTIEDLEWVIAETYVRLKQIKDSQFITKDKMNIIDDAMDSMDDTIKKLSVSFELAKLY